MNIHSLHIRVSLSVASVALIVVVLSSYFFYQNSYNNSLAESRRSVQQLLETVQAPASIAAYVGNKELAQQVIQGLTQNDIVVSAQITSANEVLAMEGHISSAKELGREVKNLISPFDDKDVVGELAVMPNLSLIAARARDSASATTLSLSALAVVVGLLVLLMVYWMMSRPLSRLSNSLHEITPGDGNRLDSLGMHRGDEIGLLVSDINVLLNTVEKMLLEERELRHRVELLESRFRGIFEDSSAGIFLVSDTARLVTANPAFFHMTGLAPMSDGSENRLIHEFLQEPDQALSLIKLALISRRPCSGDLKLRTKDPKAQRWMHCIFSPAGDAHSQATVEGVMYDVTQRKNAEELTRTQAEKDSLTGLANRPAMEIALSNQVLHARVNGKGFALMMIDLDKFKYINDTYGHDAGDQVLKIVAQRLQTHIRTSDLVARLGGDEFLILLKQTDNHDRVEQIAQAILTSQREPIEIQPQVFETIGISIGVAFYPEHGDNELTLRKHADQAMYSVKHSGKNGYALYSTNPHWQDPLKNTQIQ